MSELQRHEQGWIKQSVSGVNHWVEKYFWIALALVLIAVAAVFSPDMLNKVLPAWYLITPLSALAAIGWGGIGLRKIRQRRQIKSSTTSGPLERGSQRLKIQPNGERELLLAIRDNGGSITPAEAAIETSLTVREADWMLSELASEGHLRVESEDGALFYVLPSRRAGEIETPEHGLT